MDKRFCIDVGGSAIKYALVGEYHELLEKGQVPAPHASREEFIEVVGSLYDRYADQVSGMGVSMAGKLDSKTGYISSAASFAFFTGRNLVDDLAKRCPTHITVENDARCAALAEMYYGSLVGVDDAIVVVLGTGIGGAIITDGRMLDGARHCSAEFSLLRLYGKADTDDCWTFKGGAKGLCRMAQAATGTTKKLNGIEVFERYDAGDERVIAAVREYVDIAAVQLYNLQCVLDTSVIAIGGGISARTDLIDMIRDRLQAIFDAEAIYQVPPQMPQVVPCTFRNDANLIGAWHQNVTQ